MMIPDHDISVQYFYVHKDSHLYDVLKEYSDYCEAFVNKAEELVRKYGADSAVRSIELDGVSRVCGLHFTKENVPKTGWEQDFFGYYLPKLKSKVNEIKQISLPSLYHFDKAIPSGIRVGELGDEMVFSLQTSDKKKSVSEVVGASLLDNKELEELKSKATKTQLEHFKKLSRYRWSPIQIFRSPAFILSKKTRKELEAPSARDQRFPEALLSSFGLSCKGVHKANLSAASNSEKLDIISCHQTGKEIVDLWNALVSLPPDNKDRCFHGGFAERSGRIEGHLYYESEKEYKKRLMRLEKPKHSLSITVYPDRSIFVDSFNEVSRPMKLYSKEFQTFSSDQVLKEMTSWALKADPTIDSKISSQIRLFRN
jgi:hypothetical protein